MASAAKKLQYRDMTDGSLALNLDWAVRERELRHAGEVPRRRETAEETVKPRVRTAEHAAVRERQRVSVLSVAGFATLAAMAVLVLMSYIQLTMLSGETVALKSELAALQTEQVSLTAQYEQIFDMASVKEAAVAAGMSKPGSSQVCYLDLAGADTAVVYRRQDATVLSRVLTGLHHGVYTMVEYFD